jgi:hypothetical protein
MLGNARWINEVSNAVDLFPKGPLAQFNNKKKKKKNAIPVKRSWKPIGL